MRRVPSASWGMCHEHWTAISTNKFIPASSELIDSQFHEHEAILERIARSVARFGDRNGFPNLSASELISDAYVVARRNFRSDKTQQFVGFVARLMWRRARWVATGRRSRPPRLRASDQQFLDQLRGCGVGEEVMAQIASSMSRVQPTIDYSDDGIDPVAAADPVREAMRNEAREVVERVLPTLYDREQRICRAMLVHEQQSEASRSIGMPVGTAGWLLARMRRHFPDVAA